MGKQSNTVGSEPTRREIKGLGKIAAFKYCEQLLFDDSPEFTKQVQREMGCYTTPEDSLTLEQAERVVEEAVRQVYRVEKFLGLSCKYDAYRA